VRAAADQHDPLLAQASLDGGPVDLAGLDLLLDPHFHHTGVRVVRADALLRHGHVRANAVDVEHPIAVAIAAGVPLAAAAPAGGVGPAHDPTGSVDRREQ